MQDWKQCLPTNWKENSWPDLLASVKAIWWSLLCWLCKWCCVHAARGCLAEHSTAAELLQPLPRGLQKDGAGACSPRSTQVDAGSVPKTVTSAPSPSMHAWELLLAISLKNPLYCFKNLSLAEAKVLPAVIRAASRTGRGWDSLLGWPWHTWC